LWTVLAPYLSGHHFIAEDVNAASTILAYFPLAITFPLCGHDNDRFDPVEAPAAAHWPCRVSSTARCSSLISGWTAHDSDRRYHRP
jgi:hypothetical protein